MGVSASTSLNRACLLQLVILLHFPESHLTAHKGGLQYKPVASSLCRRSELKHSKSKKVGVMFFFFSSFFPVEKIRKYNICV